MDNDVNFNLQQFLSEMRSEMHEGFRVISVRAEHIAEDLATHKTEDIKMIALFDKRLTPLEGLRRDVRWIIATCIGAGLTSTVVLLFDVMRNHLK